MDNTLKTLLVGAALTLLPVVIAWLTAWGRIRERMETLSKQINQMDVKIDRHLSQMDTKIDTANRRIDELSKECDRTAGEMSEKFSLFSLVHTERITRNEEKIHALVGRMSLLLESAARRGS